MALDNRYLMRRRQTWYCVVEVPPSLHGKLGPRKKRTLKTRDVHVARARRWKVVAEIKGEIEAAHRNRQGDPITHEALAFREALAAPEKLDVGHAEDIDSNDPEQVVRASETAPSALLGAALTQRAEEIERQHGEEIAQGFYELATGATTPLALYVDAWLADGTLEGRTLRTRTQDERRSAVDKLADWMPSAKLPPTVEAVTRRVAGRYVSEELIPSGRDPVTLGKRIRSLTSYWAWLQRRGHLPEDARNPWAGQAPKKTTNDADGIDAERSFTNAEVARLFAEPPNVIMADFMRMGALTGMRREEIGQLTVADCADGVFVIRKGKTAAAARRVPVHPELATLVATRTQDKAPDAYLFHELSSKTTERTDPIGKAFTRYRRELGIQEGNGRRSRVNFHSFRRWFITAAINAKQPDHFVSLVVGHQEGRKGMTKGRYWQGMDDPALRAVVEAVQLPKS
jgi:integrase